MAHAIQYALTVAAEVMRTYKLFDDKLRGRHPAVVRCRIDVAYASGMGRQCRSEVDHPKLLRGFQSIGQWKARAFQTGPSLMEGRPTCVTEGRPPFHDVSAARRFDVF